VEEEAEVEKSVWGAPGEVRLEMESVRRKLSFRDFKGEEIDGSEMNSASISLMLVERRSKTRDV
jgi:hypothetical protein